MALATAAPSAAGEPGAPAPADTVRLSLADAVSQALSRGEEMRSARADVRDAEGQITEAMSQALPQLNASLTYSRQIASIFQSVSGDSSLGSLFANTPFGAKNTWTTDVTFSQLLFSGGRVGSAWKAARDVRQAMEAHERQTAADVAFGVKQSYLDAALARELVGIAEGGLTQSRELMHDVELGYKQGTRAEYDLLRAQVDVANQEPAVVSARNEYRLALLDLKTRVNIPLETPIALTTPLAFEGGMVPMLEGPVPAPTGRPALLAAQSEVEAREHLVAVEKGQRWPQLSLSSTLEEQAFPPAGIPDRDAFHRNWNASLKLEFPIFQGLRTRGAVARASAEFEKSRAERDALQKSVELEASRARADLDRALALVAARRGTVESAEKADRIARVRYDGGLATQLEVSDARLQLRTARANEVQATRDYLVALAALERAVGRPLHLVPKPISEFSGVSVPEDQER